MASELSTLLTGRNLTFVARPFSFTEYLSFHGIESVCASDPAAAYRENLGSREVLAHHLNQYLEHGGFPEALKSDSDLRRRTLLQQYFDDILAKDVVRRHRVRNHRLLKDLALVLMSNISNLMSLGRLARILGTSTSSIVTLASHLEEAHLVMTSRFFSFSTMESVAAQKPRKVYAIDTGMRNAVVSRATHDHGRLAENLVHCHLSSAGLETSYWRDRTEVDLVVGRVDPMPINVCFGDEIPPREMRSLQRFNEVFDSSNSLLITRSTFGQQRVGTSECRQVPLWAYLLTDPGSVAMS
jgi:predicted AAA+ superfamily ATPase